MSLWIATALVLVGLVLVVAFAGWLVRGVIGTAHAIGVSAFVVSVVFVGFDPENLAVGAAGSYEGVAGIALGSVVGAAMVALALAFGITALVAPMSFGQVPRRLLAVPIAAVALFGALAMDGSLARLDGAILLAAYAAAILFLVLSGRAGVDVEAAVKRREVEGESRWRAAGRMLLALAAIGVGSEMLVEGSKTLIARSGLTETFYGMAVLALLVSVEEVARELPAARSGHPEISFGNVVGSTLAFFLFNAGIIALVRPVGIPPPVLRFYLPVALVTVVAISLFMSRRAVPRWAGAVLVLLYVVFVAGGYLMAGSAPGA